VLDPIHICSSSARRKTTTPTSAWVAAKAIHHLRKTPTMGCKDLKKTLQDEQKCEIHYDTVWKGRQIALRELYGKWEESFSDAIQLEGRGHEEVSR